MRRDSLRKTNSNRIVKVYGNKVIRQGDKYIYYQIMEKAETDWENEIVEKHQKKKIFYTEEELLQLLSILIKTFAELQRNHITHLDIKPANVMKVDGIYKIGDFGEGGIVNGNGDVCTWARGTELYMAPKLYNGFYSRNFSFRYNTFKSDVYSLGICFIWASTLWFQALWVLRFTKDIEQRRQFVYKCICGNGRYSERLYNILIDMLQIDENLRPDFIQLESKYFSL